MIDPETGCIAENPPLHDKQIFEGTDLVTGHDVDVCDSVVSDDQFVESEEQEPSGNDGITSEESDERVSNESTISGDESGLNSIGTTLEQILATLSKLEEMFTSKIDRSEYELETLKKQSEEIQEYKSDLYASVLTPVLKPLVRTHSFMKKAISKAKSNGEETISLTEFEFTFDDLGEIIEDSGVEIRTFSEGDPFEAIAVKVAGQNKVSDPQLNKTIHASTSDAYLFKNMVLEKARVVVNVYSEE